MHDIFIFEFYQLSGIYFTLQDSLQNHLTPSMNNTCEIADSINTLSELRSALLCLNKDKFKHKNTVFCDGNINAKIMLIGEAPGFNEDLQGRPFCGASGKLLDKMLGAINLDRTRVYITNVFFWRPPNNRIPTPEEIQLCKPFVEKHIALIKPALIILVGASAVNALLDHTHGITKIRGQFTTYTNKYLDSPITAIAMFHPAYLLRQPQQKYLAWQDLQTIEKFLKENRIN